VSKVQEVQSKLWMPIVDKMIASLEAGEAVGSWKMPWTVELHKNAFTGKAYRGGNLMRLMFSGEDCPIWATPRQWMENGYNIKGLKCTGDIYSPSIRKETSDTGVESVKYFIPKIYHVINASYIPGYEWVRAETVPELPQVQAYFDRHSPVIVHDNPAQAYYQPSTDRVNMPPINSFVDNVSYYGTLAHEMIHWTAHKSRLDRDLSMYGRDIKMRAYEELTAEFGAAILGAQLGLATEVREDHLQYLSSWLKALKEDKTVLQRAVAESVKAVSYLDADHSVSE